MRDTLGKIGAVGILCAGMAAFMGGKAWAAFSFPGCADLATADFKATKLVARTDGIAEPIKLALDGNSPGDIDVYWVERAGAVKRYNTATKKIDNLALINANSDYESGLTGIALDPGFKSNNWIYLYYAFGNSAKFSFRLSRFALNRTASALDMASEKIVLEIPAGFSKQHTGGAMRFDSNGDLWLTVGENQGGLEGPANTNDLRGKILRIHPLADGSYSIPAGNLFPVGTAKTKPEIYIMGNRNPYTLAIDPVRKAIAWGDIGPDHQLDHEEFNFTLVPGFFGWPLFAGNNLPLMTGYNPDAPVVVNSGLSPLPKAVPAIYPYHQSCAMGGPIYYYDPKNPSKMKFPPHFNGTWFVTDFDANWAEGVTLDAKGTAILKKERIFTNIFGSTVKLAMDMMFGPDGAMYVVAYSGGGWFASDAGTSLVRIEYTGACLPDTFTTAVSIPVPDKEAVRFTGASVNIAVDGMHALEVRDPAGRLAMSRRGSGPARYDLSGLSKPGLHLLRVTTRQGVITRKYLVP